MIVTIAAIAEKKKSLAIAATTIAEIEKILSQRSFSLRSLESGFLMIAMIVAIAELFFLSDRCDHSNRSDYVETKLKLRIFTKYNTFQ